MKTFRHIFTCFSVAALLPLLGTVAAQGPATMEYGSYLPRTRSGMSSEPLMAPVGGNIRESAAPMAMLTEAEILSMAAPASTATPKTENTTSVLRTDLTEVKDLVATCSEDRVQLTWSTPREKNLREFFIERTTDAKTFTQLAVVNAGGSSLAMQHYCVVDANPVNGYAYYRLCSKDLQNKTTCWGFVEAYFDQTPQVRIWPNPATQQAIRVSLNFFNEETVDWTLVDMNGNIALHSENAPLMDGHLELRFADYGSLREGIYLLKVKGAIHEFVRKIMLNP